ncbi:MAG: cyclase family protein [Pseudonocardia sp.]|nr:cyclase family protein [Pseudonocardia sp.]
MGRIVDLSRPVEPGMPHARTIPPARFSQVRNFVEHGIRCLELALPAHIGTHLDAPSHYIEDGSTVDQVPPESLIGRAYCAEVPRGGGEPVTESDLRGALAAHDARLEPGDALLVRTGWDLRYGEDDYVLRHAYLGADAARWAVGRGVRLVGVDTITPEYPMGMRTDEYTPEAHHTLLGNGVLIIENLVLRDIANRWVTLFVGALSVTGGDGAPARVLAVLD